jgi:hypothetical protein
MTVEINHADLPAAPLDRLVNPADRHRAEAGTGELRGCLEAGADGLG